MVCWLCVFFFKQKTAYEMRISDWSSDVCSSDLVLAGGEEQRVGGDRAGVVEADAAVDRRARADTALDPGTGAGGVIEQQRIESPPRDGRTGLRQGAGDRKSVVEGTSGAVRVDLGGRRSLKQKKSISTASLSQVIQR